MARRRFFEKRRKPRPSAAGKAQKVKAKRLTAEQRARKRRKRTGAG